MALIKCVECGKMISDRAASCPNCGCPVEDSSREIVIIENEIYQELQALLQSSKPTVFKFGGFQFEYPAGTELYAEVIGIFSIVAESTSQFTSVGYDYIGEIKKALEVLPGFCEDMIETLMEFINRVLYTFKINLTLEEFLMKYSSKYELSYEKYYSQVVQAYAEICEEEEGLRRYRESVRASRGRWVGGGFGVKGAVKGAITAGMLNCASDFIHSFSDNKKAQKDTEVIKRKLRELYKSDKTKELLCESFKKIVMNLYRALMDEIRPILGECYLYDIDYEKAKALYDNTIKYENDPTIIKENLSKCIYMYPAGIKYIEGIIEEIREEEENDLPAFIQFWKYDNYVLKTEDFKDIPEKARKQLFYLNFLEYYNEFSCLVGSDEMNERKSIAQNFRKQRAKEQLEFAANIRRRLGILCKGVTNQRYVVDKPLYRLSKEYTSPIICEEEELDQYLFWMNSEVAVTDYYLYYSSKKVELSQFNEITVSAVSGRMTYVEEKRGGESVPLFQSEDIDIVDIILLLDVALDPYRELGYASRLTAEIKPLYLKILNTNKILGTDSDDDKEKKRKIADSIIKKNSDAIDRYTKEKRSKSQIKLATNLRRRFGKLLKIDELKLSGVVNQRIFELEAESKNIPSIFSCFSDIADEYIFYAEDNLAITDYNIYIAFCNESNDQCIRRQFNLYEINEIIYRRYPNTPLELYIYWKEEGEFAKKHHDFVSSRVKYSFRPQSMMVVLLLNLALEPYTDSGYYTHILHALDHHQFFEMICNYEKKHGTFEKALGSNKADQKLLQAKKDIHEKYVLEELQKIHSNDISDWETEEKLLFEDKFTELFSEFYKINGEIPEYYGFLKNIYDFDSLNYLPEHMKKNVLELKEKGQKILYVSEKDSFVITNKCVLINHRQIQLLNLNEILICRPLPAWSHDAFCMDRRVRIFIRVREQEKYKNICMIYKDRDSSELNFQDMVYALNYAVSTIKGLKENLFKQNHLFVCEECGSTDFKMTTGVLTEYKGYCRNCNNNKRKKIAVYNPSIYTKTEEKYKEIADGFLARNKELHQRLSNLRKENRIGLRENVRDESKVVCCVCGKEIRKNAKFCNFCGQSVKISQIDQEKKFCVYCGKEILKEAKFCNFCGKANNVD